MGLEMRQEQVQKQVLRDPVGSDNILNFRLSDEDFELAKQINKEEAEKFLALLEARRVELPLEQAELVDEAKDAIDELVQEYDIELPVDFQDENAQVIPLYAKDYKELLGHRGKSVRPDTAGQFIPEKSIIVMWYKKTGWADELREQTFLHTVSHELLHAKAYRALQAFRQKESPAPEVGMYRGGLHIVKLGQKEGSFFKGLNEGLTETLAEEVMNKVINDNRDKYKQIILLDLEDRLKYPIRADDGLVRRAEELGYYSRDPNKQKESLEQIFAEGYQYRHYFVPTRAPEYVRRHLTYSGERKLLSSLITAISKRNPEYLGKADDAKKLFVEAYFTGKMSKLGPVIESAFGPGTLKMIAENPFSPKLEERLRIKK